jgi:hypothetical protein
MATATGANTLTILNGLFKETYADKMQNLIPDGVKLLNMISFVPKESMPGEVNCR